MSGRYGFDQFGGFLCIASLILIVIGAWVSPILYWLGLAAIIYSYFRILSRNTRKRYAENLKYLSYQNRVTTWLGKYQVRFKQRKDYHLSLIHISIGSISVFFSIALYSQCLPRTILFRLHT